ncbi:hypothetical protein [uncultured Acinetobacter sp.]|uniref:hypothetical protein n=1 Tax=uncultured Acinetobacter sp. TaxID=165433 RepID=UPI00258926A5|nr:hypothetical protein [uncultured Acinetobacter sp.]
MTGKVITLQQLINASYDADSLADIINGAAWVEIETRLGRKCYSIATINAIITRLLEKEELGEAQIAQSVQNIADKAAQARVDIDTLVAEFDTEKDTLLVQLQDAIDVALAAGAGAAGWTDSLVQTESGLTQRVENRAFVSSVLNLSDLSNIYVFDISRIVFVKNENDLFLKIDSSDYSDGGVTIFKDAKNRYWKRQNDTKSFKNFLANSDYSFIVDDGHRTISEPNSYLIKQRSSIKGKGYSAWLTDANLILDKNSGEITNLYLSRSNQSTFSITFNDATVQPFFCDIKNIFIRESMGIQVAGAETLLHNIRIVNGNGENRLEKGISVKEKTAGAYSGGDDTSYSHVYIQGCKTGFESTTATAMYDLHVVWADFGVRIGGYDVPGQKPGQKVFFGAYMDKPYNVGIRLSGINGVAFHSPHLFEVGLYADGVSQTEEVCGIRLQGYCYSNFFSAPSFNTTDQSKVFSQILITNNAQNNTFVHANGSYKLDANSIERIRRQNFIAGCDGWARHNNFARLNRANARNVPQGGEVDLVFYLDWEYPAANSNCYLFKGSWVSRQPDTTQLTAFGDMYATVRNGCFGGNSIMTRASADVGLNWSIVGNPSLSGNQLTVRVKNNGTGAANIAVELQRSVDARGEVF